MGQLDTHNLEQLLQQAYDTLSLAVEAAGIGSWDWKIDTNEVSYDAHWLAMIGFLPDQVAVGNTFWEERLHPDDKTKVLSELEEHLQNRTASYKSEHRVRTNNGEYIWVLDVGKVIERDAFKKAKRIIGITIDITEKILTDHKIHESEEKFKSIFEHLNDAYCRFDF